MIPVLLVAAWIVIVLAAGAAVTKIGLWYKSLRKPSWQPPDWLFAPVWTLIFILAGIAFVMAWRAPGEGGRGLLVVAYVVNGILNFAWSLLFFARRRPDHALAEVPLLWISIVAMMWAVSALRPGAVWLLVPYLVWVSFAAVLNRAIVRLNAPFA